MKINEIIRSRRLLQDLTQEEAAGRLGVSAPAVSKWETGAAYPDITLLPALARLLGVDLNTLLSFEEELADADCYRLSEQALRLGQTEGFGAAFHFMQEQAQRWPACGLLLYLLATGADGLSEMCPERRKEIERQTTDWYRRAAADPRQDVRDSARSMLIRRCLQTGELDEAQALLDEIPVQAADRYRLAADIALKKGDLSQAAQHLESKLMSAANDVQAALLGMMEIAFQEGREQDAADCADRCRRAAQLFDLWAYSGETAAFQLAVLRKDAPACARSLEKISEALEEGWDMERSPLYRHLQKKDSGEAVGRALAPYLYRELESDPEFAFFRDGEEYAVFQKRWKDRFGTEPFPGEQ